MKTPDISRQLAAALRAMVQEFQGYTVVDNSSADDEWREPKAMQRARKALADYEANLKRRAARERKWRAIARKGIKR